MRPHLTVAAALALVLTSNLAARAAARPEPKDGPQLAHTVIFALKDRSPESRAKFVASCHKYLGGHEGTVSFAVSTVADDVLEPGVGDRDFDVILHMVFADKAAEAKYIANPRHKAFVAENSSAFGKVRVFDSYLTKP
jgi:Stress responsive A/B Barrel Domain